MKRIEAVMAMVDEMYSEKDTLKTDIKINVLGIEHSEGSNWSKTGKKDWNSLLNEDLSEIATESTYEANLYIFITNGVSPKKGWIGLANMEVLCDPYRGRRVNINGYLAGNIKSGDAETASVCFSSIYYSNILEIFGTMNFKI